MKRQLSWRWARNQMRDARAPRPEIREERLRGFGLLRPGSPVRLSGWRGRSGRRYVVQVHELDIHWPVRAGAGLAFAVARGDDGLARIVAMAPEGAPAGVSPAWRGRMWDAGARELHVYTLVNDETGRAEVAADLMPPA